MILNGVLVMVAAVLVGKLLDQFATRDAFGVSGNTWSGLAATAFSMLLTFGAIVAAAGFMR